MSRSKQIVFGSIFFVAITGLTAAAYFARPSLAPDWRAISPGYLKAARAELDHLPREAVAVPFCYALFAGEDSKPKLEWVCPGLPKTGWSVCAIQNLARGSWDPKVVELDAKDIARVIQESTSGCGTLVLDIENLAGTDPKPFTNWVRILRSELLRATQLSIAVHAKTSGDGNWSGNQSQDWAALCQLADELIVMAYDYHYPGVTERGETAPIGWVEQVLRYGLTSCPAKNIRLGLAAYGYRWPSTTPVSEREAGPGDLVETAAQRQEKQELARSLGIDRFFLWALGMEHQ